MPDEPGVFPDPHGLLLEKPAALDDVPEADVGPYLALGADPHVVVDGEPPHGVQDGSTPDPAVAADLQRLLAVGEGMGVEFAVVPQAELGDQDPRPAADVAVIPQDHARRAVFAVMIIPPRNL